MILVSGLSDDLSSLVALFTWSISGVPPNKSSKDFQKSRNI